jgi:hypothetical protein
LLGLQVKVVQWWAHGLPWTAAASGDHPMNRNLARWSLTMTALLMASVALAPMAASLPNPPPGPVCPAGFPSVAGYTVGCYYCEHNGQQMPPEYCFYPGPPLFNWHYCYLYQNNPPPGHCVVSA